MSVESQPRVLAETGEWVVVDKPSGWLSVPGRSDAPVLVEWIRARFSEAMPVHRLDLQTSGVILFARGPEAHRRASLWFQNREVKKQYVLLATGRASRPLMKIQKPVEGAACTTQVEVLKQFSEAFYGRARPLGGKRHQIRIHLAGEKHPLLGDERYGGTRSLATRVALHAEVLELPSGERFSAPLPEDFSGWLAKLENP